MMKAVILAGGQDIGKCPLSLVRPRPLFPVPNGVLLQNVLQVLGSVDVDEAIICANGKTHILREHFGASSGGCVGLDYHEDKFPRGAAGCLRDVADSLRHSTFIVIEGGLFIDGGIGKLLTEHRRSGNALTIGAVPAGNWQAGNGTEPLHRRLSPVGIYVVEPDVLRHIPDRGFYDIKEQLVPELVKRDIRVRAARFTGLHRRMTNAGSYALFVQEVLSGAFGESRLAGYREAAPHVWIAPDASVHPSASIVGPAVIGPNVVVERNVTILGPCLISESTAVGEHSTVSGSIIWSRASVGSGASVERSIVTDGFCVRKRSRLENSIAIGRYLNVGEMHGLRQGGYTVSAPGRIRLLEPANSAVRAVSGFCRPLLC